MRGSSLLRVVVLCTLVIGCREVPAGSGLYFGETPPGDAPAVFASGVVSQGERFEQFLQYAPDGRGLIFGVTDGNWGAFTLYEMTLEDGGWTEPAPASFLGADSSALTGCLTPRLDIAFFTAARPGYPPADIWMSERGDAGWSQARKVPAPVSSDADEWEVAVSRAGTLYFSSTREGGHGDIDIYRAPLVDGGYPTVENLGPPINTSAGDDLPYIAPDESYLIFASDRPGGLGFRDLYISYQIDGSWTDPINLGSPINTEQWDIYPSVSPDGRYLFFTRRKSFETSEDSDIYWVSAGFIDRLRPTLRSEAG